MTARAQAVEETRGRICEAAVDAWLDTPYDDMTLDDVARRAGTTRQTVLRHFGSKAELVVAAAGWYAPRIDAACRVEPGDVAAAIGVLVARYEVMGPANVRMLEVEDRFAEIRQLLDQGRAHHRAWVVEFLAPASRNGPDVPDEVVDALYVATDVTAWKLLRRDHGRSVGETAAVMERLVRGALEVGLTTPGDTRQKGRS